MKANVLFSGGKDSSLSALLLEPFFKVELITCTFGNQEAISLSKEIAKNMNLKHDIYYLNKEILNNACDIIINDGFPNNAITYIHKQAIYSLAKINKNNIIADGLRRDDRVPKFTNSEIRSIEDTFHIHYINPLIGYSRSTINKLVDEYLIIQEDESKIIQKCDYELELRNKLNDKIGELKTNLLFPKSHMQSRVISRKK